MTRAEHYIATERAIMPALLARASPDDKPLIAAGIKAGWVPSHHDGHDDIAWLRFRAACARAEIAITDDAALRRYLVVRALQADNEAAARERSLKPPADLMDRAALGWLPTTVLG